MQTPSVIPKCQPMAMREAVAAIESTGKKVFTFAPSAEASRGVLRSDAGFANAETVEALLQNEKLQAQVRGQVIWIDEAGILSVRTLARVADFAEKQNCRIILSGDTAQHRAVERGDALRHFGTARQFAAPPN